MKNLGLPWRLSGSDFTFQCRGSGQGAKIPHNSWLKTQNTKQKQYCKKFNKDLKKVAKAKKKKLNKKEKPLNPPVREIMCS